MKSSIRMRLLITFIVILLITEIGLVFLSNLFLEDLVTYANRVLIKDVYNRYHPYFELNEINKDQLNTITSKNDIGIVIYENGKIKACSSLFICTGNNPTIPTYITNKFPDIPVGQSYSRAFRYSTINVHQLVYIYNVGNGRYIIVDKSLSSIKEVTQIIRPVILIAGALVFVLGSIAIFFTSKRISKPIVQISDYANDLANLKFDEKLTIDQNDEIGQLALSMNLISEKLNVALTELKEDLEKEKELDRKRVKYFSTVSHEFKTPLTIIQGYAEGIKHNIAKSKEDMEEYCDVIIDESKKMNRFVNDLLNLSMYESDNFTLKKSQFDFMELVLETENKFKEGLVNKKVQYQVKGPKSSIIYADQNRIEQVINNLLSNAIKHVTENGIIEINVEEKEKMIRCSIYNNGEKINENDLLNIWNLFYKLENNNNQIGTGIGLAIVKSIVELHQGNYGVMNKENGVLFYIEIPK